MPPSNYSEKNSRPNILSELVRKSREADDIIEENYKEEDDILQHWIQMMEQKAYEIWNSNTRASDKRKSKKDDLNMPDLIKLMEESRMKKSILVESKDTPNRMGVLDAASTPVSRRKSLRRSLHLHDANATLSETVHVLNPVTEHPSVQLIEKKHPSTNADREVTYTPIPEAESVEANENRPSKERCKSPDQEVISHGAMTKEHSSVEEMNTTFNKDENTSEETFVKSAKRKLSSQDNVSKIRNTEKPAPSSVKMNDSTCTVISTPQPSNLSMAQTSFLHSSKLLQNQSFKQSNIISSGPSLLLRSQLQARVPSSLLLRSANTEPVNEENKEDKIRKKQEKVDENLKKISTMKQKKVEESKRKREEKMERVYRTRLRMEKEKEERFRSRERTNTETSSSTRGCSSPPAKKARGKRAEKEEQFRSRERTNTETSTRGYSPPTAKKTRNKCKVIKADSDTEDETEKVRAVASGKGRSRTPARKKAGDRSAKKLNKELSNTIIVDDSSSAVKGKKAKAALDETRIVTPAKKKYNSKSANKTQATSNKKGKNTEDAENKVNTIVAPQPKAKQLAETPSSIKILKDQAYEKNKAKEMVEPKSKLETTKEAHKSQNSNSTFVIDEKPKSSSTTCPDSCAMTPPSKEYTYTNYDISDVNSDDTDDDDAPRKPIPSWAQGYALKNALIQQYYNNPDLDMLFGTWIEKPDLAKIFQQNKREYKIRTSSAIWNSPREFLISP